MKFEHQGLTAKVVKAMGMFGGLQVVTILCGMVRNKCTALWIGPEGEGLFGLLNAAFLFLATASQLNLRNSAVAFLGGNPEGRMVSVVRTWGWLLGLAGLILAMVLSPLMSYLSSGELTDTWQFALLGAALLFASPTAAEQSVMQSSDRLRPLAKSSLEGALSGLAVSLTLLYFLRLDGVGPTIVVYALAGYLCVVWRRNPRSPRISVREAVTEGSPMLRLGLYLTVATAVTEGLNFLVVSWVQMWGGTAEVGVFQAGFTIASRYFGMVFAALAVEYYPRLVKVAHSPRRTQAFVNHELKLVSLVLIPLVILTVPLANFAIRVLYSSDFLGAAPYIVIALPGIMLRAFSWTLALVIVARGDGLTFLLTEVASSVVMTILSIGLYGELGIPGLAAAFSLDYLAYSAMIWAVCRKKYHLHMNAQVMGVWCFGFVCSLVLLVFVGKVG